jgi:hypothetical protein
MSKVLRSKRAVEVAAVIGIYFLFLTVGVYSGQTTISIDLVNPPDGAKSQSSPVELVAKAAVRGEPLPDASMRFRIGYSGTYEVNFDMYTDTQGMATLTFPAWSGNYTWMVTAEKHGYPSIMSTLRSFSVNLSLTVDALLPSTFIVAFSPVKFVARVAKAGSSPVESANVTFYVDSAKVGSTLTDTQGIARLSSPVEPGTHTWFASAGKDDEGGISRTTSFIVGSTLGFTTGDSNSRSYGSRFTDVGFRCHVEIVLSTFESMETRGRLEATLQVNHDEEFDCPEPIAQLR